MFLLSKPESAVGFDLTDPLAGYSHTTWLVEQGLPQNSVKAIIQTRDGYIWLGTREGLVRFNGFDFKIYNQSNTREMKADHITAFFEDSSGCLWIGTWGGGICCLSKGRFTSYTTRDGLAHDIVRCIEGDKRGNLWIGTWGGGLSRFRENSFTNFTHKDGLTSLYIYTVFPDPDGDLWVGTWGGGLNHYENGRFSCISTEQGLDSNDIMSIARDHKGFLWAGTEAGGLNRLENNQITLFDSRNGLRGQQVLSIFEDCDQNLWVGTWGGGLFLYKNNRFHSFPASQEFSSNIIRVIFQDREKNIWIGTSGTGLNRLKKRRFFTLTTREGLSINMVRTVYQSRDGSVWMGTDGGGVNRLINERFTVYTTKNGLSSDSITSLLEDSQGNLWIGTGGGGLNKLSGNRFTTLTTDDGLSGNHILSLAEDRTGNIWVGTWGNGLSCLSQEKISKINMKNGLSNNNVMVIHIDREGKLWIGTGGGGLNTWENGVITRYSTREGLAGNYVLSIHEDREGTLWIGTFNNGLSRFKQGRFDSYSTRDGLYSDTIFCILEDEKENLWMSSNQGIFRISKSELNDFDSETGKSIQTTFYNKSDGMETDECTGSCQPSGFRSKDGTLWFPTPRGIAMVNPGEIQPNTLVPPVVIEKIKVDEEFKDPAQVEKIGPGKKTFEFHYTALSYVSPEKIRFRYRLHPFNDKWVEAGSRRIAYYTNIPAGIYRFQVTACNSDGLWNTTGITLRFELEPYFYQTAWFYLVSIMGLLALGFVIHLWRVRQIILRERRKYEKARIPAEDADRYFKKLIRFMKTEKPYLDPDISLPKLARELMIPDHYLSQIINSRLKQNFFDFINSYRIKEAQGKISDPNSFRMSFLQIAFDVGFNSKSAFNRAFKKHTSLTPSEFKKNLPIS